MTAPGYLSSSYPEASLKRLLEGNQRYAEGLSAHPHLSAECRLALSGAQYPFAAILSCADSRVPPELIFDAGLGDLFTVRVAGNIVDDAVIGSLEYAVRHLNVSLVLVMGHTSCGAVQAAIQGVDPATHLTALVEPIRPAVERACAAGGDLLESAVRENVRESVRRLIATGPVLSELTASGRLTIVGAVYTLRSGRVELFDSSL